MIEEQKEKEKNNKREGGGNKGREKFASPYTFNSTSPNIIRNSKPEFHLFRYSSPKFVNNT
jgi:hypothetical protein